MVAHRQLLYQQSVQFVQNQVSGFVFFRADCFYFQVHIGLFNFCLCLIFVNALSHLLVSSMADRIKTACLQPLGREKYAANPNCKCSACTNNMQPNLPWMQSVPRYCVVDNHQRPVPDLNPIRSSSKASSSSAVANNEANEMLQTQIKFNTELLGRVDALTAEKNAIAVAIKAIQADCDRFKKESVYYKTKFDEAMKNQLKEKTKHKSDTMTANKGNVDVLKQADNASNQML